MKWIVLAVLLISGTILGFLYYSIKDMERNPDKLPLPVSEDALTIAHAYKDGAHRFAGYMYLPNSCHDVRASIVRDGKISENFELRVTTRDKQLETAFCSQLRTRYYFHVLEEGPELYNLKFYVSGKEHPYKLVEGKWQSEGATLQTSQ